jgi:glycosyltransferase involved in cell wall biosynthesis
MARGLVFPSHFEGWGMPVLEAFCEGLPVALSRASCLPEVAAEAGLLFDPNNPEEMAECILRLCTHEDLRAQLIERGHVRAAQLSLERCAKTYRAIYRSLAGFRLSAEDMNELASA